MGLLDFFKRKTTPANGPVAQERPIEPECTTRPDCEHWGATRSGFAYEDGDYRFELGLVECGPLQVPSGRLVVCDPFAAMARDENPAVAIPPGEYPVIVTIAAFKNEAGEITQHREAYASLLLKQAKEVHRRYMSLLGPDEPAPDLKSDEFIGFGVDAGTACFVDQESLTRGMPDDSSWYDDLFENDQSDCWFARMDDPSHIRRGIANIPLPKDPSVNLILFHSGWGDGVYPVVGGYDAGGDLVAVHIDFNVVPCP